MQATIGVDFLVRNLTYQNKQYRFQLWDTAGQERFRSLIPSYLKDSVLCLLVYDLGCPKSLEDLAVWQDLYNKNKEYTAFSIAVGNKSDKPKPGISINPKTKAPDKSKPGISINPKKADKAKPGISINPK